MLLEFTQQGLIEGKRREEIARVVAKKIRGRRQIRPELNQPRRG